MGKGAMSDIMEKGGCKHKHPVFVRKPEPPAGNIGKVHSSQRMFKPCMVCTGVNEVGETQLVDVPEPLEGRSIQKRQDKILHFYIAMYRVLDNLHGITKESSYTSHKSIE
jgi:hypothetical protein